MSEPLQKIEPTAGPPCFTEDGLRLRYTTIPPSPKQAAFLALTCREALYGGAAGGGKSIALMEAALQFVDVPGYNALLLRRTLADLKLGDSLIPISKQMLSNTDARWNGQDYKWTFPSGAVLQFGYLRNPGDELRYQGAQFQFVGFDELTQFPDEDQYLYLQSRLRRPKMDRDSMLKLKGESPDGLTLADIPLRIRGATNPGGPGSHWVKRRFVDPETRIAPFLPSLMRDNPGLDPVEYAESLAALSEVERRRLEHGDWEAMDIPGALWSFADMNHDMECDRREGYTVKVVAIDGAVSEGTGDECGIILAGMHEDGKVKVIADCSKKAHPDRWSKTAVALYHNEGATRMIVEDNQGGELNRMVLRNAADTLGLPRPNIILVKAKESKEERALPVAQAYKAGKVDHLPAIRDGALEAQMASWIPGLKGQKSPDRIDALVWAVRHLIFGDGIPGGGHTTRRQKAALQRW